MQATLPVFALTTLLATSLLATEASRGLRPQQPRFAKVTLTGAIYPETLAPLQYMGGNLSCITSPSTPTDSKYCPTLVVSFNIVESLAMPPELAPALEAGPVTGGNSPNFWIEESGQLQLRVGQALYQENIGYLFSASTRIRKQWSARDKEHEVLFVVTEACDSGQGCRAGLWVFTTALSTETRSAFRYYTPALIPLLNTVDWKKLENDSQTGLYRSGEDFWVMLPFTSGSPQVVWQVRLGGAEIFATAYPAAPRSVDG